MEQAEEKMSGRFRIENFVLDPGNRQLLRDNVPVELNGRYLDALILLVREQGKLVSKDRFLEEVWRGVPVTDEALTQCIKTLRRQLGDSAADPHFIETIPKHGYRFIAPVMGEDKVGSGPAEAGSRAVASESGPDAWKQVLLLAAAGTIGGGVAGVLGGLFYGFGAAYQPLHAGVGAASVLLVLICLTLALALIGAAGVSVGIAAASIYAPRWQWMVSGGAVGGIIVGAVVKLLGLDAFNLLFGQSPGDITGAAEGALLGSAIGLAAWLNGREGAAPSLRRSMLAAALIGGSAGVLINLLGGRLMGGSLALLARSFRDSRLRLDQIGGLFGEKGFGPVSEAATGGLEGMLFGACIVGAMFLARRHLPKKV